MSQLSISLLGTPQILIDQDPIRLTTTRAMPILGYLAINQYRQSRETLANLLWTESNQNQALAALRTTLWRLKQAGLENWISWDRSEVRLTNLEYIDIDVRNFQAQLDLCNSHGHPPSGICVYCTPALTKAVTLYRGEFMKGFNISRAPAFDDWRMQQSETFETMYLDALERLVNCHRTFGDFNLAIRYARMWTSADRLNENSHIQLFQLYSITGQRTSAISLYKHYKDSLYRELGLQPTAEITSLYKQIVIGRSVPVSKPKLKTPVIMLAEIDNANLYWGQVGDRKDRIHASYINIIKEISRRFGGSILQKSDNNVTLLFENGQPLHAAITLHTMLKKAEWGTSGPPSIRMVLYSTVFENDSSTNFALLTRIASSLLSISWGGQVVFTDQTLRHLELPSRASVKDLGFHYLNETCGSVHVFELIHPYLPPIEHPQLLSKNQQLNHFPSFEPQFIGREPEMEQLSRLVLAPANRFVSLIGPGGVGKTRLAIEFATRASDHFPDGIFFVSLASIQDPKFIPIVVADAIKYNFFGDTSHDDQLGDYLHRMKLLLIVDNFEHLRVEGAKFLTALLSNTHFLKILVTSRERVNLVAESVLEVRGFPVPKEDSVESASSYSSIKLFLQNAHKTYPRFSDQNNMEAIIRICQVVDGIPLGILLASSWVRVFSCAEIASEINKNIEFLKSSAPDLDPRHRSLTAVFDSSWELLSEEERRIMRRLAIFQSDFSIIAAQEICHATPSILATLVEKSLLYRQPDGRYFMLSTFNQYAYAILCEADEELVGTRTRFAEFFSEYCSQKLEDFFSSKQRAALMEMSYEIENIRTAWSIMIETDRWDLITQSKDAILTYHLIVGNYYQGENLFNSALAKLNKQAIPEQALVRAFMQQLSAWLEFRRGFTQESLKQMNECLDTFRRYNFQWEIGRTLYYLAEMYRLSGNHQKAKNLIEQAIPLLQNSPRSDTNLADGEIAFCQLTLGRILLNENNYAEARKCFMSSLETHQKHGTLYGTIFAFAGLASVEYFQGEFIQARNLYRQALDIAIDMNDHRSQMFLHNNLSDVCEVIANVPESQQHLQTALKLCKETGDRRLTAVILNNLAYQQLRYDRQPSEAIRIYHECMEIFSELGDLRGVSYSSYDVSKAYLKAGRLEEAWNYCVRCLDTALLLDSTPMILHAIHGFANFLGETGQIDWALSLCSWISGHPEIELDTKKRAIVTTAILETLVPAGSEQASELLPKSTDLQVLVKQVRSLKPRFVKN